MKDRRRHITKEREMKGYREKRREVVRLCVRERGEGNRQMGKQKERQKHKTK